MIKAGNKVWRFAVGNRLTFLDHDLDQSLHCVARHASRLIHGLAIGDETGERRACNRVAALGFGVENESVSPRHAGGRLDRSSGKAMIARSFGPISKAFTVSDADLSAANAERTCARYLGN